MNSESWWARSGWLGQLLLWWTPHRGQDKGIQNNGLQSDNYMYVKQVGLLVERQYMKESARSNECSGKLMAVHNYG